VLRLDTPGIRRRAALEREVVDTDSIAAALEHRLYPAEVDRGGVRRGCDYAAEVGLAAVLCRPEHVAIAARRLTGSGIPTVTALAFQDAQPQRREPADLAAEAVELMSAGASEVALSVAPGLDGQGCLDRIGDQVQAVVEAVVPERRTVRVILNTTDVCKEQMSACTQMLGSSGVALVQGGTYLGDRATFSQIEAMRHSLPAHVLLKWTQPLKSVEMMLVCMALGVNRFNGDVRALVDSARRSSQLAPLMVPVHGVDF
jgi:deoxyribose-phosphate aldolase